MALVLGFKLFASKASAQGLSLQVAPARQELSVQPGERSVFNVRFFNFDTTPVSGTVKVADFVVINKDGSPHIIDNTEQVSPRFSAASWITLPYEKMTIAAENKVSVQVEMNVPESARPGGRYIAVYFEPIVGEITNPSTFQQEAVTATTSRIAALVYIRVAGEITEKAQISKLFTPSFHEYGPFVVKSEIINNGDYHIRPRGTLTLSNMFGGVVDQVALSEYNIFPDTAREYENEVGYKWMVGRYKLTATASYGEQGQAVTRSVYVWLFPWRVAAVVALAIIIIILLSRHFYNAIVMKEKKMAKELETEHEELEKLKKELRKNG
jgi:hypothetical protein